MKNKRSISVWMEGRKETAVKMTNPENFKMCHTIQRRVPEKMSARGRVKNTLVRIFCLLVVRTKRLRCSWLASYLATLSFASLTKSTWHTCKKSTSTFVRNACGSSMFALSLFVGPLFTSSTNCCMGAMVMLESQGCFYCARIPLVFAFCMAHMYTTNKSM